MNERIQVALRIAVAPSLVFQALTQADELTRWFAEHAEVAPLRLRYDFWGRFTPAAPDREQGQHAILSWKPDQELAFQWQVQDQATIVTMTLESEGDGTNLTLVHEDVPKRRPGEVNLADFWILSLENLRSWVERGSAGPRCDFSAPGRGDIRLTIEIGASPGAVFPALIAPSELERYIASTAMVEPRIGGRYDFGWGEGPQNILELAPNERLAYSWSFSDEPDTVVTWTLDGSGGRTRLTLVHSGFGPDRLTEDYQAGWLAFLNKIKCLSEVGPSWRKPTVTAIDYAPA